MSIKARSYTQNEEKYVLELVFKAKSINYA